MLGNAAFKLLFFTMMCKKKESLTCILKGLRHFDNTV